MSRFAKIPLLLFLLGIAGMAFAQPGPITQFCVQGGTGANVSGLKSTNYQQGIVPTCTVTVYLTGTLTKATIYSDVNSTPLSNPFTAASPTGTAPGQWIFYAATGQLYDVVLSGGVAPNIYTHPVTLTGLGSGGGGGGGGGSPGGVNQDIQYKAGTSAFGGALIDTDSGTQTNLAGAGWLNTPHPTPAGQFNYLATNGVYSALMAQTGGGNNGIANALTAAGSNGVVNINSLYTGSDGAGVATNASFTGSISGTTLTASSVTGTITLGGVSGVGLASGTFITAFVSGTPGGAGTYTITPSQTVGSESMNVSAVGQLVQDLRGGSLKNYLYNNQTGQANYTWCANAVRNGSDIFGGGSTCTGTDAYFYGLGNSEGNGFVYNSVVGNQNVYNFVPGILNVNVHKINCFADGDCNQYQYFLFGAGNRDPSAEGIQYQPWHIDQFPTYIATVNSVIDSRHIRTTPISGEQYGGGWIISPSIESGTILLEESYNGRPSLKTSATHTATATYGFTTSQCFNPVDPQNGTPCTIQVQLTGGTSFTTTATFTATASGTTLTTSSVTGTIHIGDQVSGVGFNESTFITAGSGPTYTTSTPNTITTPVSAITQNLNSGGGYTNGSEVCETNTAGGGLWIEELTLTAVTGIFSGGGGWQQNITANVRYPTSTGDRIYAGPCIGIQFPVEAQNIVGTSQNASNPNYVFAGAPDTTHYFLAGFDGATPATLPITFPSSTFANRDSSGNVNIIVPQSNAFYIPRLLNFPLIAVSGCSDSSMNFSASAVTGNSTTMTASISGFVLTVTAVSAPTLQVGGSVVGAGVASNTFIVGLLSGTGGTGTYEVGISQTVGGESMTSLTPGPMLTTSNFPVGSNGYSYDAKFIQPGTGPFTPVTSITGCTITGSGLSAYTISNVAEVQSVSDPAVPVQPQSAPNSTPPINGYMQLAPNSGWVTNGQQIEQPGGTRLGLNNTLDYTQYTPASPSFKSSIQTWQFQGLGTTGPGQTPLVFQNKNQPGSYQGYGGQWPIAGFDLINMIGVYDGFLVMNLPSGQGSVFTFNCPFGPNGPNCSDVNPHTVMSLQGPTNTGLLQFIPNSQLLSWSQTFAASTLTSNNSQAIGFYDGVNVYSNQVNNQGPCTAYHTFDSTSGIAGTDVIGEVCGIDFGGGLNSVGIFSANNGDPRATLAIFREDAIAMYKPFTLLALGGGGVQCVQTDNIGNITGTGSACGSGGGGGSSVTVNGGSTLSTANFGAAPAAGTNGINVTWQTSGTNVSAEIVGDGNAAHCFSGVGTWVACAAGTGISGLTAGFLPLAGSSTTLTANSHCDDGITSAGVVTCSEPFVASTLTSVPAGGVGGTLTLPEGTTASGIAGNDICYADSTLHGIKCSYNNGAFVPNVVGPASSTNGHVAIFSGTGGNILADGGAPGTGTVTSIATTGPLGGGTITTTGTLTCTTCVVASSPGVGIAHFAGSTQTVTSSLIVAADISSNTITGTQLASSLALVTPNIGAATGTSLLVTGNVDGTAPMTITTGTTASLGGTFKSGYTLNQEGTAAAGVTYTLPTAAAGLQYCIGNSWNGSAATTGVLTLATSASGQFIIFTDGTLSATGGNVTSGGAAADAACVVGVDSTHWQLYTQRGSWTKH